MKLIIRALLAATLMIACACQNDNDNETGFIAEDGLYSGTFTRTGPGLPGTEASVSLTIDKGTFNGESNMVQYPAICHGTFTRSGDSIFFVNECVWTANFDWTLVLSEGYKITKDNTDVLIVREYENGIVDTYRISIAT